MWIMNWEPYYYYQPVTRIGTELQIATLRIDDDGTLIFRDKHDGIQFDELMNNVLRLEELTSNTCQPQLAYYVFAITHRPTFMESYFPITKGLRKDARRQFHETITKVMLHPGFDLQLLAFGPNLIMHHPDFDRMSSNYSVDRIRLIPALSYLVAGHIVEMFFFRQDILDKLLQGGIRIWLYTDQDAFKADGGVAGGCYNPRKGCVQLVVSRLFEGFNQPTPGAAPFIHEFGHLLDYFDANKLQASRSSSGWLPGMRESDGTIYVSEAREAFIVGKRLEMDRYDRQVDKPDGSEPLPIGHPYVFQSNSEFIAGYLEMFFRNPHYFAAQNPDLFDGFTRLFKQDPRPYWEADFPYYVHQNRTFYLSGQRLRVSGLKLDVD